MTLTYFTPVVKDGFLKASCLSPADEKAYASRLREIENALLCQAFGGQVPLPDSQQRLQRYLDGEISRAEAFQPTQQVSARWAN